MRTNDGSRGHSKPSKICQTFIPQFLPCLVFKVILGKKHTFKKNIFFSKCPFSRGGEDCNHGIKISRPNGYNGCILNDQRAIDQINLWPIALWPLPLFLVIFCRIDQIKFSNDQIRKINLSNFIIWAIDPFYRFNLSNWSILLF